MASIADLKKVTSPGNNKATLHCRVTTTTNGAVPNAPAYTDILSIVRVSAGLYTLTLRQRHIRLLDCSVKTIQAAVTPAARGGVWHVVNDNSSAATPTVQIRNEYAALVGAAAVAVDPPDASTLLITLVMDMGKI